MKPLHRHSVGFTLIELMVAMVAGLLVVGAGLSVLSGTLSSNADALRYSRLNQDLRSIQNVLGRDLARAGYWEVASRIAQVSSTTQLQFSAATGAITVRSRNSAGTAPNNAFASPLSSSMLTGRTLVVVLPDASGNPTRYDLLVTANADANTLSATVASGQTLPVLIAGAGSWTVLNPFDTVLAAASNTCIVLSYDVNRNGVVDTGDPNPGERIGYRLDSVEHAIESASDTTNCVDGAWQNITDPDSLNITGFSITPMVTAVASNQLNGAVRGYTVRIDGQLKSDAGADRSFRETIKVRNNAFH